MIDRSDSRIDHLNIAVPDLGAAVAFDEPVLASIGITEMLQIPGDPAGDFPAMTGFGLADVKPYFWLGRPARRPRQEVTNFRSGLGHTSHCQV